jgi:FKBP-type peptidyl-prolyl cis-trans isomerase 2
MSNNSKRCAFFTGHSKKQMIHRRVLSHRLITFLSCSLPITDQLAIRLSYRSAISCRRLTALISAIMLALSVLPLIFITEPSWGPRLSSSKMVSTLVGGLSQEDVDGNLPVAEGTIVFMEYTFTIPESDLTIPNNFILFEHGHHDLLPNIEKTLTGMKRDEEKRIDLSSEEAFGPYDESKRGEISRDRLPADVQSGMIFVTEEGVPFVIVDLVGTTAKIDFNHPLAGRHVVIDVRIVNVEVSLDSEQDLQPNRSSI